MLQQVGSAGVGVTCDAAKSSRLRRKKDYFERCVGHKMNKLVPSGSGAVETCGVVDKQPPLLQVTTPLFAGAAVHRRLGREPRPEMDNSSF
jgi:hypothetical protein